MVRLLGGILFLGWLGGFFFVWRDVKFGVLGLSVFLILGRVIGWDGVVYFFFWSIVDDRWLGLRLVFVWFFGDMLVLGVDVLERGDIDGDWLGRLVRNILLFNLFIICGGNCIFLNFIFILWGDGFLIGLNLGVLVWRCGLIFVVIKLEVVFELVRLLIILVVVILVKFIFFDVLFFFRSWLVILLNKLLKGENDLLGELGGINGLLGFIIGGVLGLFCWLLIIGRGCGFCLWFFGRCSIFILFGIGGFICFGLFGNGCLLLFGLMVNIGDFEVVILEVEEVRV